MRLPQSPRAMPLPAVSLPTAGWALLVMLGVGYALALAHGRLSLASLPVFAGLLLAGICVRRGSRAWQLAGHAAFVCLALGLGLHGLPGFHNAMVSLPPASQWHALGSFYLNLDKPLIGVWLLLACPWAVPRHSAGQVLGITLLATPVTLLVCLLAALASGLVVWLPGWSPGGWLWAANNLLLVCVTEELLFRGYLQGALVRRWPTHPVLTTLGAAALFGLAHAPGGAGWAVTAGLAGIGYGWAYHRGGLLAAVAVHFAVNLVYFGGFVAVGTR